MKKILIPFLLLSLLAHPLLTLLAQGANPPFVLPVTGGGGPPPPTTSIIAQSGQDLQAILATTTAGQTIHVLAGNYTNHNLLKDGVNWYFDNGATVYWWQHCGETNAPGAAPLNEWQGIFDDRTTTGLTNGVTVGGYGDFVMVGPGAYNHLINNGLHSSPFELLLASDAGGTPGIDYRVFSNSLAGGGGFPNSNTVGIVAITNPATKFTMYANSIRGNQFYWPTIITNNGGAGVPVTLSTPFGVMRDIYIINCKEATFFIKTLGSWSGSNNVPGDVYGVPIIENDNTFGQNFGWATNYASGGVFQGGQLNPFGGISGSPILGNCVACYWDCGDTHLNVEHLEAMSGAGNNGLWANCAGPGQGNQNIGVTSVQNWWIHVNDCETYMYDSSYNQNARVWFDFQQYHDTHNGFGGITLEGDGKVYIRGEKMMYPTNSGYCILLFEAKPVSGGGTNGEVWMNLQKLAFDTTGVYTHSVIPSASGWIMSSSYPKLYANIEQMEDTGDNISNSGGGWGIIAGNTNSNIHLRGQVATLGNRNSGFLQIQKPGITGGPTNNIVIEGFHIDGSKSTQGRLVDVGATNNLVMRNVWAFAGNTGLTTNFIGTTGSAAAAPLTWVTLQGVYANQTNMLNVAVTNGGSSTMHWP